MKGWVKLHRQLQENPIWTDSNYLKLWLFCLFEASHKDREQLVGNAMVQLDRGQFVIGRKILEEKLNKGVKPQQKLNEITWWRYLKNLEKWKMLNIKTNNKFSVVTVVNYSFYQDREDETEQHNEQQVNNNGTTTEQQLNTNKNLKNLENVKNEKKDQKTSCRKLKIYNETNVEFQLSLDLLEKIKINNPSFKEPNLQKWSDDIRLMMDRDKRTEEQIKYLIDWCQNDSFWKANILSPAKLRKQFDALAAQAKVNSDKSAKEKPRKILSLERPAHLKEPTVPDDIDKKIEENLKGMPY